MNVTDIINPTQLAELNTAAAYMGEAEAQEITSRIRTWVRAYPTEDVARAFTGRIWLVLGYESWQEYCDCELDGFKIPSRAERPAIVEEMRWDHGMSGESIAVALGVSKSTVSSDISTLQNRRVDLPPPATGKDGRTQDTSNIGRKPAIPDEAEGIDAEVEPKPMQRKRKPIIATTVEIGWGIRNAVDRIDKLRNDDRFESAQPELNEKLSPHIKYAIEVLTETLTALGAPQ